LSLKFGGNPEKPLFHVVCPCCRGCLTDWCASEAKKELGMMIKDRRGAKANDPDDHHKMDVEIKNCDRKKFL
jgi:hypothetical protein